MAIPFRMTPLLLLAAALSGCSFASTTVGWPTVVAAETEAQKCIQALATNDKALLMAQGLTDTQADKVLADAAGRVAPGEPKLMLDDFEDERYFRKYQVPRVKKTPTDHATMEILVTFVNRSSSDYAHITSVEFIESKE